jgi:hypothetical protein
MHIFDPFMLNRLLYIFLLAILFRVATLESQSVNVPLNYWGYDFLYRCEAMNLISPHDLRTRPLTRNNFSAIIHSIEKALNNRPNQFSRTDRRQFDQLKSDFSDELFLSPSEPHLLEYREKQSRFYLDALASQSVIVNRNDQYNEESLLSETMLGGILRGHLGQKLGFYSQARNTIIKGKEDVQEEDEVFNPSQGPPTVVSGSNLIRDQAIAYLVYEKSWLRLQIGRDRQSWGPGYRGHLALSGNMKPVDMLRLSTRMSNFTFSSFHAFLRDDLGAKFLAAHRLDIKIRPGFYLGATETLIYGGRDIELGYLNPIMPYHVAEHHLGDRDNNAMSIDATLTSLPAMTLYAEFFIDDMTTTQNLTRFYGNKFAFTLGGLYANPLSIQNTDLRIEYTRIEPYVYTHWDSLNIYRHAGEPIGHWAKPNSEVIYARVSHRFNRDVQIQGSVEQVRHGKGDFNTISRPDEGVSKSFLQGIIERRRLFTIKLVDQIRRDFFASISYSYSDTDNANNIPGEQVVDHIARFELSINY